MAISGGLVVLLVVLVGPPDFGPNSMQVVPLLAVPIATLLGLQYGPVIARSPRFNVGRVTIFTVEAVLLGDAAFVLFAYGSGLWTLGVAGPLEAVSSVAFMLVLGVVFFGLPFFFLSWPFVALWAVILRRVVSTAGVIATAQ